MTYRVFISDPLSEDGIYPLQEADDMEVVQETDLTNEQLHERLTDYDALLVRSQTKVTRELIENAHRLKVIGRAGVGVDNIDLEAATEYGIMVVNAPDGNTNSAAEHTMAMLASLARNIPQADAALKQNRWDRKAYVGVEMKGKTLGIVGLGRVGAEVAARAQGQRMNVIAYDPFLTAEQADNLGIRSGSVADVLQAADFITAHTPLLNETKHIINKEAFEQMKDGVRIVNCARGGIIDEDALYEAIINQKVAGAGLDVFEEEPVYDHKLLELPEVIATPHLGASTVEAQRNVAIDVSNDVVTILRGGVTQNAVNMPSVPQDIMNQIAPYFDLAAKLGTFLAYLEQDAVEEIHVYYAGELAEMDVTPLTRNTVKGLLKRHLGNRVNDVNAAFLAEKKGITIHEQKTSATNGFTDLLTAEIKTKSSIRQVAGTLLRGLGARIVKIDHYSMDLSPQGHMVFIRHNDQPGAIGRVGGLLADNQVNIATMQVGRTEIGGEAIMMLVIDKPLKQHELNQLKELTEVHDATAVEL
ncbi:phosphoglycerate dehydrogenase [Barrientosiimonas marina]|uniref:D-3-phosphoglycerate dehydrogenase n=1 Tax=Lentibacillus kimchii TaxID=1542911 RepID=A0ABW2UVC6_9BACI